ncbi:MAG: metal-dependent hydrolase [Candidatus Woesearchaeota archaeon]
MDNLTHGLFGLFIGIVVYYLLKFKTSRKKALIAAVIMAELPDIDIVVRAISAGFYLEYHRQVTHSIIVIIIAALLVAWIMKKASGENYWKYAVLCVSCIVSHVFLDLINAYGTQILYPFSHIRHAFSIVPVVDIYVFIIFGTGVVFLKLQKKDWYKVARATLFIFFIFLLFKSGLHFNAVNRVSDLSGYSDVHVVPEMANPFGWRVIVDQPDYYLITNFDLTKGGYEKFEIYEKESNALIETSKEALIARQFLAFSKYPYASVEGNTVTWVDMRYRIDDKAPFSAEITLDDDFNIVGEKLKSA